VGSLPRGHGRGRAVLARPLLLEEVVQVGQLGRALLDFSPLGQPCRVLLLPDLAIQLVELGPALGQRLPTQVALKVLDLSP
jgi:hypothetical protein